jgi:hypothetical protein
LPELQKSRLIQEQSESLQAGWMDATHDDHAEVDRFG